MIHLERNEKSESLNYLLDGLTRTILPPLRTAPIVSRLVNDSKSTTKTFPAQNSSLGCPDTLQLEFPPPNGTGSFEERSSTSITSSHLSTVLQLMKRERHALAMQKSALESLMRKGALAPLLNSLQHGTSPLKLFNSHFPTMLKKLGITVASSPPNSLPRSPDLTRESSFLISQSATSSKEASQGRLHTSVLR